MLTIYRLTSSLDLPLQLSHSRHFDRPLQPLLRPLYLALATLHSPHPILPLHAGSPKLCHLNGDQIENESHQHGKDEEADHRGEDTDNTS